MYLDICGENTEDCRLYLFAVFQSRGCVFLDEDLEVCALMDWDSTNKTLNVNISYLIFSFCLNTDLLTH